MNKVHTTSDTKSLWFHVISWREYFYSLMNFWSRKFTFCKYQTKLNIFWRKLIFTRIQTWRNCGIKVALLSSVTVAKWTWLGFSLFCWDSGETMPWEAATTGWLRSAGSRVRSSLSPVCSTKVRGLRNFYLSSAFDCCCMDIGHE